MPPGTHAIAHGRDRARFLDTFRARTGPAAWPLAARTDELVLDMAVVLRFSLPFTWDTKDTGTARHHPSGMRHGRAAPASPLAGPLGKLVVFYPRHSVRVGALEGGAHPLIAGVDVFGGDHVGDPWRATTSLAGRWAGGSVSIRSPSGLSRQRLMVTWFDWRTTCRISDRPTPTSTAYRNGMIMVSAKVVSSTAFCTGPVFQTD